MSQSERRLAAIMYTDMVGYTALGQRNESLSLALVDEQRKLLRPIFNRHSGKEIKTMGDAFLVEFPSALDAVRCAYDIQRATREFNITLPSEKRVHLRVGVHLGDVVETQGDISGDAVNVASRIELLAEDGGVCLTQQVYDHVQNKFELPLESIGSKSLKNVSAPLEVYRMVMPWEQSSTEEASSFPANRIAILPFASFSLDPNDGFFADGITDEIISTVSGISGLSVISRTSVTGYKGTTKKVKEIGKELEVGSILEGTFKKAGNRIRITTQLIDVAGDKHLWAQNYDRELNDVFEVQSDVAKQVADALRVRILSPEMKRIRKKPTESTTAYALYLKGRYLWNKREVESIKKAAECFTQAVKEDPGFALGYVGQADCLLWLRNYWETDLGTKLEEAKTMLAKALELDPELAEAHATKGNVLMYEYKPRQAEEEFKKAIELNPSYAVAHSRYSWALMTQLRWDEAFEQGEKALELDPLTVGLVTGLVHVCYHRRDYGRAFELAKRAALLDPSDAGVHFFMTLIYGQIGKHEEARREADTWVELIQKWFPFARLGADALIAVGEGDKETARKRLPELEAHFLEASFDAFMVASGVFFIGDYDKGFEWLERSYARKEPSIMEIKNDENLDGVRTDPRYLDFLMRLGLD
ncbi:MAG: adenylate/guanylate cyclase domain-containing protein [Nitrososphaerales archaeon]